MSFTGWTEKMFQGHKLMKNNLLQKLFFLNLLKNCAVGYATSFLFRMDYKILPLALIYI